MEQNNSVVESNLQEDLERLAYERDKAESHGNYDRAIYYENLMNTVMEQGNINEVIVQEVEPVKKKTLREKIGGKFNGKRK